MENQEIRKVLKGNGVRQWELAEILGVSEWTLCRKLRRELNDAQKAEIFAAIEKLKVVK